MAELSEESIELASIRSKLGMTIRKFAERLGEPEARYKNWEYGLTKRVPYPILQKARSLIQPSDVTDIRSIAPLPTVRMPYAGDLPAGDWGEPLQSGEFEDVDARYFKPNRFIIFHHKVGLRYRRR